MNLSAEEGTEHNNKKLRFNREHHSRKFSVTKGLRDIFMRSIYSSDPKILRILEESLIQSRDSKTEMSQSVIDLLESTDSNNPDSSESDTDSVISMVL